MPSPTPFLRSVSRRRFLRQSLAASLAPIAFPAVVRGLNLNGKLQVASVGINGMGLSDISDIGSHPRVHFVGFCDVDSSRFGPADKKFPGVAHFQDFREMYSKLGATADAVSVSTPDHMHAPAALAAMRLRKHVYCQKPLAHTVWECRQLRLAADKSGVITQMGNQIHSASEYRTSVKLLQDGVIGKIKAVHSWVGVRGNHYTKLTARPASGTPPASLDWNLWTGTAPLRPFAPDVYHPFKWRDWQDFGSGALGDFGCHILDPVFTALEIRDPISIAASHDGIGTETWPGEETIHYEFHGTRWTVGKVLGVTWYDGGRQPDRAVAQLPSSVELPKSGSLFLGEGGTLILPHVGMPIVHTSGATSPLAYSRVPGGSHYHAWVDAVLANRRTSDGFHYAGPLAETVQLGNVAARFPGQRLEWDAARMRLDGATGAGNLLSKRYRRGWRIPTV